MRTLLFLGALLLGPGGATAAIYECPGPDGETVYQSEPCSEDAQPYEPQRRNVQRVPSAHDPYEWSDVPEAQRKQRRRRRKPEIVRRSVERQEDQLEAAEKELARCRYDYDFGDPDASCDGIAQNIDRIRKNLAKSKSDLAEQAPAAFLPGAHTDAAWPVRFARARDAVWVAEFRVAEAEAHLDRCRDDQQYTTRAGTCAVAEKHVDSVRAALEKERHYLEAVLPDRCRREGCPPDSAEAMADGGTDEALWRARFESARDELVRAERRLASDEQSLKACGHVGRYQRHVSCDPHKYRVLDSRARFAALQHYLDERLPEECRKAGCLPGWVR